MVRGDARAGAHLVSGGGAFADALLHAEGLLGLVLAIRRGQVHAVVLTEKGLWRPDDQGHLLEGDDSLERHDVGVSALDLSQQHQDVLVPLLNLSQQHQDVLVLLLKAADRADRAALDLIVVGLRVLISRTAAASAKQQGGLASGADGGGAGFVVLQESGCV